MLVLKFISKNIYENNYFNFISLLLLKTQKTLKKNKF